MTQEQKRLFIERRSRPTKEVIADLPESIRPHAYIVGAWVWVQFDSKPNTEIIARLKEQGFTWNNRRKVWQNPCGVFRPASSDDPRGRYGMIPVDQESEAA